MQYRRLGRAGIKVSAIGLGSWLTYGHATDIGIAQACIRQAFEAGINHFDSANVYGQVPHAAEAVLATALEPFDRSSYILTTKAFWPVGDGPNDRGLSRKHVFTQVEQSLSALRTDYVDIFYCHRFDPETEVEETLGAIDDLITQGKVLYAGVSEWSEAQTADAVATARRLNLRPIRASQPAYNLFNRGIEAGVLPLCEREGIGVVAFSPLAQGLLTGKYRRGAPLPAGSRATTPRVSPFITRMLTDTRLQQVELLAEVAADLGMTLSQLALAWVLRQPAVASALTGASRPEQVAENVKAAGIVLTDDTLARIDQIIAE